MTSARRYLFLSVLLCLGTTAAWASSVVVNTSLSLTNLQISPTTGTLEILSPVTVSVFAQAPSSSGTYDQESDIVNDAAASVNASADLANASGAGSASALTGSVTANVNLPDNFNGIAFDSEGDSVLSGTFEINGTSGSVNVTFGASLTVNRSTPRGQEDSTLTPT
jgi:hypothetical protein